MTAEGHKVASLHGAKDAQERDAIIDGFREGKEKVLITTNVIARGIDILQVNMVVNYDLPLMNEQTVNNINKWNQVQDVLHHDAPQAVPAPQPAKVCISSQRVERPS